MKLGLTPFKEFSLNCFSSILFSLLDYVEPDNKLIVFANNYNYEIREIKQTVSTNVFKTLSVKSDITLLEEVLLQNKMTLNLKTYNENLITDKIIELLEQNKIILVEIDLFYGVKDSLHYKKII